MGKALNFYAPDEASIERLRLILETRSGDIVSFDEALEISTQLLSLYECLARDRNNDAEHGRE